MGQKRNAWIFLPENVSDILYIPLSGILNSREMTNFCLWLLLCYFCSDCKFNDGAPHTVLAGSSSPWSHFALLGDERIEQARCFRTSKTCCVQNLIWMFWGFWLPRTGHILTNASIGIIYLRFLVNRPSSRFQHRLTVWISMLRICESKWSVVCSMPYSEFGF